MPLQLSCTAVAVAAGTATVTGAQAGFAGKTVIRAVARSESPPPFEAPKVATVGPEYPAAGVYVSVPAVA